MKPQTICNTPHQKILFCSNLNCLATIGPILLNEKFNL